MNVVKRICVVAIGLGVLANAVFGADLVGKWVGHLEQRKSPQKMSAEEKKEFAKTIASNKLVRLTLQLKADKTYSATYIQAPGAKVQTSDGIWKADAQLITLHPLKRNGLPVKRGSLGGMERAFEIKNNGKSFEALAPGAGKVFPTIVYVRG
jgi:hypothetical protein